jgi:hypothetical protein
MLRDCNSLTLTFKKWRFDFFLAIVLPPTAPARPVCAIHGLIKLSIIPEGPNGFPSQNATLWIPRLTHPSFRAKPEGQSIRDLSEIHSFIHSFIEKSAPVLQPLIHLGEPHVFRKPLVPPTPPQCHQSHAHTLDARTPSPRLEMQQDREMVTKRRRKTSPPPMLSTSD